MHSMTSFKLCKETNPSGSVKNAFQFLITRQQAPDDPEMAIIAHDFGAVDMWSRLGGMW